MNNNLKKIREETRRRENKSLYESIMKHLDGDSYDGGKLDGLFNF